MNDRYVLPKRSRYVLVEWSAEPDSVEDKAMMIRLEVLADGLMQWMVGWGVADAAISMGPGDEAFPPPHSGQGDA